MDRNKQQPMNFMQESPDSHLRDVELIRDGPYDQMPGDTETEQHDVDQIPEVSITQDDLDESADRADNWLIHGNSYDAQRLVPTDGLNPNNVGDLELEYRIENPVDGTNYQGTPMLVHGDPPILYHSIGTDYVYAANARTGDVLWIHDYQPASGTDNNSAERGFAIYEDKIIRSTVDFGVIAINRYTGEDEWYFNGAHVYRGEEADGLIHEELAFEKSGPTSSYPPVVYDGTILKGSMGAEWGVNGWFDGLTLDGEPKWRVNTTPEEGWVGDSVVHAGGTTWASGSLDPENDLMIMPVSNPAPWYGTPRPGWNPHTAGKLAVDIETGEYKWHYQDTPHDWWDYDSPGPSIVYDAEVDGEERRLVSWAPKNGWVFTVDAETGQLVQRSEGVVQHHNMWSLPPKGDIERAEPFMPTGTVGGTAHQPGSFHPESRTMVVTATNEPFSLAWEETEYELGEQYVGSQFGFVDPEDVDEWNGNGGAVVGLDPVSGEVKWRDWRENGTRAGTVTTSSGVTISGTGEGELVAYDTRTGDQLWADDHGGNILCHPIVWEDPNESKHYVATGTGGSDGVLSVYSVETDELL